MLDMLQSGGALQRPRDPQLAGEWQATMNSLAQELAVTERKVQEAMELTEMTYAKVLL